MVEPYARDLVADFAHQLRQPLSTLEALISCLELIIPAGDERAQEQLRRMHFEVGTADQILSEGARSLMALLANQPGSRTSDVIPLSAGETVEGLSCALTSPATASVTY